MDTILERSKNNRPAMGWIDPSENVAGHAACRKEVVMHPLKMLFDEINHDRWGIPSKGRQPTRRRQEPPPKFLAAIGDGVRKLPSRAA